MPLTRRRRIVRRAVLVLAGVILLLCGYVGSWGALHWLMGRGTLSISTYGKVNGAFYAPLILLEGTDTTVGRFLAAFSFWCGHKGHGGPVTFSEFWQATEVDAPAE